MSRCGDVVVLESVCVGGKGWYCGPYLFLVWDQCRRLKFMKGLRCRSYVFDVVSSVVCLIQGYSQRRY